MSDLLFSCSLPIILSAALYLLERKTPFGKLKRVPKQIIIGVLFGLTAIYTTWFGIDVGGKKVMNVCDSAPVCAGLIFGPAAGVIAGIIAGLVRWFPVYFGISAYTQLACSLSAVLAGLISAWIRRYMFDDKKPGCVYGFAVGIVVEILHMLMIFITNTDDMYNEFDVVRQCALSMITLNSLVVLIAMLIISVISGEWRKRIVIGGTKTISAAFQAWLLVCVAAGFAVTCVFTFVLQTKMAVKSAEDVILLNIDDVKSVIDDNFLEQDITKSMENWHIGENGFVILCDKNENIISTLTGYSGKTLAESGIFTDGGAIQVPPRAIAKSEIFGVPSYCAYDVYKDYIIIGIQPLEEAWLHRNISVYLMCFMEILAFGALFILIYFLIKRMIVDNMRRINSTLSQISGGNLEARADVRTHSEFVSLSDDINTTVDTLKRYIAEAAARLDAELEIARSIQKSALPDVFLTYPNRHSCDIFASMDAAKEVGGDFYDFFMIGEDKFAFLIADVSGKGIPAAMFMMSAKTTIKNLAETGMEVNDVFTRANSELCENNEAGMFVTAWMAILDLKTGVMSFANAGHNPPLIRRANGTWEYMRVRTGFVLAGMEGVSYRKNEIKINPGDEIYLYTDGVTEANNVNEELYGEKRLLEVLDKNIGSTPEEYCKAVTDAVWHFVGKAPQFDDMTMLMAKFNYLIGDDSIIILPEVRLEFAVNEFIEKKLSGIPEKIRNKINVVVDEIYSNAAFYSSASYIEISCAAAENEINLTFADNGKPYNPLENDDPDITLSVEERRIGGLGIFMVKKMMDKCEYEYLDERNVLKLSLEYKQC